MIFRNIQIRKYWFYFMFILFFSYNSYTNDAQSIIYIQNPENRVDWINDYFANTRIFNTNIIGIKYNSSNIVLKTREGCFQTGFYLKKGYYDESRYTDRIYVVSTINDLEHIRINYIELPFLDTISSDYFNNNHLVFIITGYSHSSDLRNERIEIIDDKYSFIVDFYYRGEGTYYLCAYTALYILEIPKL